MINISEALTEYLSSTTRLLGQYVRVEITTKYGVKYTINDAELSGGSIKLSKKSVSGSTFDIGECYINEVSLTIIDKTNKFSGSFDNAEMSVFFGVKNDELGLDEEVQLGKFIIPPDTTIRKITAIQLVGDSFLSKLDLPLNGVSTSGKLFDLVSWCCDACGIEFALTEDEFNALSPNTSYTYYINADSAIESYRDVIMYISQIIGGFATDTNDGKLTFKVYSLSNDVFNINNDTIASSKLGDSDFKLNGLSLKFGDKIIYVEGDFNSDYLLELDSNPLLDLLTEDVVTVVLNNIWSQVKDIPFKSFDFQYNGNPALECGDILNNDVRGIHSFITSLSWTYHGKSSVVGASLDKRVKTQSQSVKKASMSGGSGGSSSNELSILRYINTEDYKLSRLSSKIVQMYFILPSGVSPLLTFTMVVKTELTGLVSLQIIYDNVEMIYKPRNHMDLGYHTFSFTKSLDASDSEMLHSLSIYATFIKDANQEIDYITPCSVAIYDLEANIMGWKATTGTPSWTGRYEITETFGLFGISNDNLNILPFSVSKPTFSFDDAPVYGQIIQMSASEAVLRGSSELRSNSSALSGYDIDYIGDYPDDGALWSIELDVDSRIILIVKAASGDDRYLDVYIDDVLVSNDLLYNSGSHNDGIEQTVVTDYALSAGTHTIGVGKDTGSYAPLVDYIIVKCEV